MSQNGGSTSQRNVPDVATVASDVTVVATTPEPILDAQRKSRAST